MKSEVILAKSKRAGLIKSFFFSAFASEEINHPEIKYKNSKIIK